MKARGSLGFAITMLETTIQREEKKKVSYKRDTDGHLMCHLCEFKPNATAAHPKGNPSTLCHHIQKKHSGTNQLAYVCKHCGHGFLHKFSLETHIASRHPEANQTVEMFKCDVQGCEYESLTRGNLEIHKARKHYSDIVAQSLQLVEQEASKAYNCICCMKTFNSSSAFNYHIVKDLQVHKEFVAVLVD